MFVAIDRRKQSTRATFLRVVLSSLRTSRLRLPRIHRIRSKPAMVVSKRMHLPFLKMTFVSVACGCKGSQHNGLDSR